MISNLRSNQVNSPSFKSVKAIQGNVIHGKQTNIIATLIEKDCNNLTGWNELPKLFKKFVGVKQKKVDGEKLKQPTIIDFMLTKLKVDNPINLSEENKISLFKNKFPNTPNKADIITAAVNEYKIYLKSLNHESYILNQLGIKSSHRKTKDEKRVIITNHLAEKMKNNDINLLLNEGVEDKINWSKLSLHEPYLVKKIKIDVSNMNEKSIQLEITKAINKMSKEEIKKIVDQSKQDGIVGMKQYIYSIPKPLPHLPRPKDSSKFHEIAIRIKNFFNPSFNQSAKKLDQQA
jgi:hypothetical protein